MHDSRVDNKCSLYADDSSFYTVGNTVAEIGTNLNQDLKKVRNRYTRNSITKVRSPLNIRRRFVKSIF